MPTSALDKTTDILRQLRLSSLTLAFSLILLAPSVVLSALTTRALAVPYAFYVQNQLTSLPSLSAETLLGMSRQHKLAYVALYDKKKHLIYSEPRRVPQAMIVGESGRFSDKLGWSVFRLSSKDRNEDTLYLGVYAGSLLSFDSDSPLFGPSPQLSLIEIILIVSYEALLASLLFNAIYGSGIARLNNAMIQLMSGSKQKGLLDTSASPPWYWTPELKLLRKTLLAYESRRQDTATMTGKRDDSDKWRSTNLELEKASKTIQMEVPRTVALSATFSGLGVLREEMLKVFDEKLQNTLVGACILVRQEAGPHQGHFEIDYSKKLSGSNLSHFKEIDLDGLCDNIMQSPRTRALGTLNLSQYKLTSLLSEIAAQTAVAMPLQSKGRSLGLLLLFSTTTAAGIDLHGLERTWSSYEKEYLDLYVAEMSKAAEYIDKTTGLHNRQFVNLTLKEDQNNQVEVLALSVVQPQSQSLELTDATTASLLLEFDRVWRQNPKQKASFDIAIQDENLFILLCRQASQEQNQTLIRQLGQFLQETLKKVGHNEIAVAFGYCNEAERRSSPESLRRAIIACEFAKSRVRGSVIEVADSASVPKDFHDWTKAKSLKGKLGVFDASEILQSLGSGQRTGRLTVDDREGRSFRMLFDAGRPVEAKLLRDSVTVFVGGEAICEYITTFSAGDFQFSELSTVDRTAATAPLPPLVTCLMDGALAQDQMEQARRAVSLDTRYKASLDNQKRGQLIKEAQPNKAEIETMQRLENLCSEPTSVADLLERLAGIPSSRVWHCLFIMQEHGLLASEQK